MQLPTHTSSSTDSTHSDPQAHSPVRSRYNLKWTKPRWLKHLACHFDALFARIPMSLANCPRSMTHLGCARSRLRLLNAIAATARCKELLIVAAGKRKGLNISQVGEEHRTSQDHAMRPSHLLGLRRPPRICDPSSQHLRLSSVCGLQEGARDPWSYGRSSRADVQGEESADGTGLEARRWTSCNLAVAEWRSRSFIRGGLNIHNAATRAAGQETQNRATPTPGKRFVDKRK